MTHGGIERHRSRLAHRRVIDRTSTERIAVGGVVVYADVSEKIVSRKPLGSLTSNARLFHSVS